MCREVPGAAISFCPGVFVMVPVQGAKTGGQFFILTLKVLRPHAEIAVKGVTLDTGGLRLRFKRRKIVVLGESSRYRADKHCAAQQNAKRPAEKFSCSHKHFLLIMYSVE